MKRLALAVGLIAGACGSLPSIPGGGPRPVFAPLAGSPPSPGSVAFRVFIPATLQPSCAALTPSERRHEHLIRVPPGGAVAALSGAERVCVLPEAPCWMRKAVLPFGSPVVGRQGDWAFGPETPRASWMAWSDGPPCAWPRSTPDGAATLTVVSLAAVAVPPLPRRRP